MPLKLFPKLLLAFLLTAAVLVLGMAGSVNWTFERGLQNYLYQKEIEQLDKLIPVLENLYAQHGSWEALRDNPRLLRHAVRTLLGRRRPPSHAPPPAHYPPRHAHEDRPPRPPRPPRPRIHLFDRNYQLILGREAPMSRDTLRPLHQNGDIIGWVGIARHRIIDDSLAAAFHSQQRRNYLLIALLALLVSGLAAWLLVAQLLAPIRRITAGANALSKGAYQTRVKIYSQDELGQLAADFNHLADTLEHNEQARRQWIADISHELRTPLAVLRGEIEAMQDGVRQLNPHNLKSLHAETLSLNKLVDDLYELTLSDLGALDYRFETLDIATILNASLNAFSPRFTAKNLHIDNQISGAINIRADSRRLTQLFSNLLENSLRYTHDGGSLQLSQSRTTDRIILQFADSAPNVPDAALPHLFERLYRVDKSRSRILGGAGLGLSICRNIVNAHQGNITASHSPLGGLCVHVELPLRLYDKQ